MRECARIKSFLTVYVSALVFLENSLRPLHHVTVRFALGPLEEGLLQLALQQLHETVGVCVVVNTTASREEHTHTQTHGQHNVLTSGLKGKLACLCYTGSAGWIWPFNTETKEESTISTYRMFMWHWSHKVRGAERWSDIISIRGTLDWISSPELLFIGCVTCPVCHEPKQREQVPLRLSAAHLPWPSPQHRIMRLNLPFPSSTKFLVYLPE